MKKISIIGIIIAIVFVFGFTAGGFGKFETTSSLPALSIEKALPSGPSPNAVILGDPSSQDNSIFSWSTIISLSVAVIGIVAFRRNTYY